MPQSTRKATRLTDLTITQVAGVDFPAHLHDGWAVMKAAGTAPAVAAALNAEREGLPDRIAKAASLDDLDGDDKAVAVALIDRLIELLDDTDGDDDGDGGDPNGDRTFDDIRQAVQDQLDQLSDGDGDAWVRDLNDTWVVYIDGGHLYRAAYTLADDGTVTFGAPVEVQIRTSYDPVTKATTTTWTPTDTKEGAPPMPEPIDKAALPPEIAAHLTTLEKQVHDLTAERDAAIAKAAGTTAGDSEDVLKGVDPAIRDMFAKAQARAEEAEKVAKAEREHRLNTEYLAKAAAHPTVPVSGDELAKALRQADEIGGDFANIFGRILASHGEMAKQARILRPVGSDLGAEVDSPTAKLDALAKARAKETGEPFAKAYTAVLDTDEGAALYQQINVPEVG